MPAQPADKGSYCPSARIGTRIAQKRMYKGLAYIDLSGSFYVAIPIKETRLSRQIHVQSIQLKGPPPLWPSYVR
jgi:hypothetical protein